MTNRQYSTSAIPSPAGATSCHPCGAKDIRSDPTPLLDAVKLPDRGSVRPPQPVCPKCGAEVPDGWPSPGFDHCVECGVPLGRLALTNDILEVTKKTRPLAIIQAGLMGSGGTIFAGILWYSLSLPSSALSQAVPLWALEDTVVWLALWVAGVIALGIMLWMNRRELRRRAIDSRVARAAAQSFFPRYAISRLIRSGRLGTVEPVVPHSSGTRSSSPSATPSRTPRLIGYGRERRPRSG